jgi:hypothetical protein
VQLKRLIRKTCLLCFSQVNTSFLLGNVKRQINFPETSIENKETGAIRKVSISS